ncbi:Phosphoribosyl transferase domain [Musa troglodytarum]|uniref:adenine phosphoribosyltransferase n=1 Tax=Musa troglodytarum TaxID=320322 RepID=A0A9E7EQP0_9LILI|nr:Phosphoribosyl transferase domain [Musa troglodytarum]URD81067.1 Phosphoribosyl transferase domain [Musa troglodytarum]
MACGEDKEQKQDPRIEGIAASIRVVPDFPKKGIMFQDITTLLLDPKTFKNTVDLFVERYLGKDISVVAGVSLDLPLFFSSVFLDLANWVIAPALMALPSQWPCYHGPSCELRTALALGLRFPTPFMEVAVATQTLVP